MTTGLIDKFLVLIIKRWSLTKRRMVATTFEIAAPIIICVILILTRSKPEEHEGRHFAPFHTSNENEICVRSNKTNIVAYAPTNYFLKEIVSSICSKTSIAEFNNASALNKEIEKNVDFRNNLLLAVLFNDDLGAIKSDEKLVNDVKVTLRLQTHRNKAWHTDILYPKIQRTSPRSPESSYGGAPYYHSRGFLHVQEMITIALMSNSKNIKIKMQRFPHTDWSSLKYTSFILPVSIFYCFLFKYMNNIYDITAEKEQQLQNTMKAMGVPIWLLRISWFTYSFVTLFITIIIMLNLLTLHIGADYVFRHSNQYELLLFLTLASCNIIAYSFLISTLLSKANISSFIIAFCFFSLSQIPYLLQRDLKTVQLSEGILLAGSVICYGVEIIVKFEEIGKGIQWDNMWITPFASGSLVFGSVLMMLIVDTLLYLILGLYLEVLFQYGAGKSESWYFPCTRTYWCSKPAESDATSSENREIYEEIIGESQMGIQLENISKTFGTEEVVKNVNLTISDSQITVLLGPEGSGKSTILSLISRIQVPTKGKVIIYGFDAEKYTQKIHSRMGFCPQYNSFFSDMSVLEHLRFFGKLKGTRSGDLRREIKNYIKFLDLEWEKGVVVKKLSKGEKRKLSVAIALCGGAQVVLLDEPTFGLDPLERKTIWDLLRVEKKNRTILLTTRSVQEAEILGDRVAVITNGEIQCCGSNSFLKKQYASWYYLILEVGPTYNRGQITNILKNHTPGVEFQSYTDSELVYKISKSETEKYESMLKELEENMSTLQIKNLRVSSMSLEEKFFKIGANPDFKILKKTSRIQKRSAINFLKLKGKSSLKSCLQFIGIVEKKIIIFYRLWLIVVLTHIIIPVVLMLWILLSAKEFVEPFPALNITLDSYDNPVILIGGDKNVEYQMYKKVVEGHHLIEVSDIAQQVLKSTSSSSKVRKTDQHYIVAASFTNNTATAWFDGQPYHAAPLALGLVLNTYFKFYFGEERSVNYINHPLPLTELEESEDKQEILLALAIVCAMISVASVYIFFCIRERVSKFQHLQMLFGVNPFVFWVASFLCDFLVCFMTICVIITTVLIVKLDGFSTEDELGRLMLILVCFTFFLLPFVYLLSCFFKHFTNGFGVFLIISFLTGPAGFFITKSVYHKLSKVIDWILIFTPFYSLMDGIVALRNINNVKKMCLTNGSLEITCQEDINCCDIYYSFGLNGIGRHITIPILMCILLFAILICKDYGYFNFILNICISPKYVNQNAPSEEVQKENDKIRTSDKKNLLNTHVLVLRDVTKYYGRIAVVNRVCLGVKPGECLGILGPHASGKTTLLRMMTGEESISYGKAWINGLNIKKSQVRKKIGFCPQDDALLEDLTLRQILKILSLIRGVSCTKYKDLEETLATQFDFSQYLDKQIKLLNFATRKRVSISLALIGDPLIIFLDEPTSGLDPATKRFVLKVLAELRDSGKCIILSSRDVEECDALCTRVALMLKGEFHDFGSIQKLKKKFARKYVLTIKMKRTDDFDRSAVTVDDFIKKNLPGAVLQERYQKNLFYHLAEDSVPFSKIFGSMERGKKEMNVEDYCLRQCGLEEVLSLKEFLI